MEATRAPDFQGINPRWLQDGPTFTSAQHESVTAARHRTLAIRQWWVADSFGKGSGGRRVERDTLHFGIGRTARLFKPRWSFADGAEIAKSLKLYRAGSNRGRATNIICSCGDPPPESEAYAFQACLIDHSSISPL